MSGTTIPLSRRLTTAAMWPFGVLLTSWSYMWRTTPIYRRQLEGSPEEDFPRAIPDEVPAKHLQGFEEGTGNLFHRLYSAKIKQPQLSAAELFAAIKSDPNIVAPLSLARFEKASGEPGAMRPGDEYLIRMPGPWDGPVRVLNVGGCCFRFGTLSGHLEAGQIEWRAYDDDGSLVFQIESWARAGDRVSAVLHGRLRMAKEVQVHMWTSVAERVARKAGGKLDHGITVVTRSIDEERMESLLALERSGEAAEGRNPCAAAS